MCPEKARKSAPSAATFDRVVRHQLGAVHQEQRADGVGELADLAQRRDDAGDVRLPGHRDDLRPVGDKRRVDVEPPVRQLGEPLQRRAGAQRELLPRHQVGVVLDLGDEDLVSGPQRPGEPERDQVDGLGRRLGEDDLVRAGRRRGTRPPSRGCPRRSRWPPRRAGACRGARRRCAARSSSRSASSTAAGCCDVAPSPGRPGACRSGRSGPGSGSPSGSASTSRGGAAHAAPPASMKTSLAHAVPAPANRS